MWNAETAQFLHNWYATPEGTYAITQENRLFQHLISQWPRRGHTLLDIGCGAGIFLEMPLALLDLMSRGLYRY